MRHFAGMSHPGLLLKPDDLNGRQVAFLGDLPVTPDHGKALAWSLAAFAALAVAAVLVAARPYLDPPIGYGELVVLSLGYGAASLGALLVSWSRLDRTWVLALLAAPIVYVTTVSAATGGGSSPFVTLYAPLLGIVAWHLSLRDALVAGALVVSTEVWRTWVVDGAGSMLELAMRLPFDVAVAVFACFAAAHLRVALTEIRRDQVRMDAAVRAMRELESNPASDVLGGLRRVLSQIFDADVVAIELDAARPRDRELVAHSHEAGIVSLVVGGPSRIHGLVRLATGRHLSPQELRLATLMTEVAGRIAEARMEALQRSCDNHGTTRDGGTAFAGAAWRSRGAVAPREHAR